MACTIIHTETDGFLGCKSNKDLDLGMKGTEVPDSSAIWQVVYENDHEGSSCKWEGYFRIRHVASGRFLSIVASSGGGGGGGKPTLRRSGTMAVHLDAKGKAGSDYKVSLVEGKNADETELLFRFEPQYTTTGVITTHHFLRVRHESHFGLLKHCYLQ